MMTSEFSSYNSFIKWLSKGNKVVILAKDRGIIICLIDTDFVDDGFIDWIGWKWLMILTGHLNMFG